MGPAHYYWRSRDGLVHVTEGHAGASSLMQCERYVIRPDDQYSTADLVAVDPPVTCLRCIGFISSLLGRL